MTKQLSNISDEATERTNVVDVMSPILEFQPDDGLGLVILGMVAQGDENGFPVYLDLRDANDDPLPVDTSVSFQYKAPSADDRTTVTDVHDHIRSYNSLTIDEQQNVENIDQVKHVLKGTEELLEKGETPTVQIRDIDRFFLSINASTQIDWTNSRAYIDRNAVRQVN